MLLGGTRVTAIWGLVLAVVLFLVGNAAVVFVVVRLPAKYFVKTTGESKSHQRSPWQWTLLVGKNLLGLGVVLVGVLASLPAVPGPGLVLVLLGLMLLDFPGKRRLQRKLASRPSVLRSMNWVRERFGKPPLEIDEGPKATRSGRGVGRRQGAF
jgi:hypothetical protein